MHFAQVVARLRLIGISRPRTSYSHQAAIECFDPNTHVFEPKTTIEDIFVAVEDRTVTYGVVPFENSTNGSVVFTLDLFCDRSSQYRSTRVCGEAYLDVHHCLLSPAKDLKSITKIYSHPQAFGQCETWLNANLKGVERVDVSSTSKAAQIAAGFEDAGAIASKIASDVKGLKILAENIEDSHDNTTRFFVLSATKRSGVSTGEWTVEEGGGKKKDKSLLSFTIDHKLPGALCDSLRVFKDFDLNLTSIVSRPTRVVKWNYIFFVEFEGHAETDNAKQALEELKRYCVDLRVLGSYVDKQGRKGSRYKES
ncbi:uncharacterized protein LAJ45_02112 [Morchella importuna]|uniref:uncharacterized protein n=1 Tax=Morchella importuna TaxID=1174673 RepID=UPI001E8D6C0C|nr:uncharacterized protein LAJ45_02112 [Morchella importuna]KAH8154344.1 hypothetical protein LAJ45_02112 [Morchella importuna]